jgi:hypothetical protein
MTPNWHELIQAYISGTISDADAAVLETQLKLNETLRDQYLDAVNLDSALVSTAELAGVKRTLSPQISESPIHPTILSRACLLYTSPSPRDV